MLIDMHAHTWPRSHDSVLSPDDLVERAKRAGLDAICFTEHDTLWDEHSIKEICERHNFLVLAGVEISTDDGHILTFGIDRYVFGMHRSRDLAHHVDQHEGTMVAAHPYRRQMPWHVRDQEEYDRALERAAQNPAYQYVTALEELNGRGTDRENAFSKRLCGLMGMPGTAGTDSHEIVDIGKCATYFEREIADERDLIRELKAGRFYAVDLRPAAAVRQ
ncbi:MAG: CehA/McbA family metallohydrolase [Dehalococcoidia bacterium]